METNRTAANQKMWHPVTTDVPNDEQKNPICNKIIVDVQLRLQSHTNPNCKKTWSKWTLHSFVGVQFAAKFFHEGQDAFQNFTIWKNLTEKFLENYQIFHLFDITMSNGHTKVPINGKLHPLLLVCFFLTSQFFVVYRNIS